MNQHHPHPQFHPQFQPQPAPIPAGSQPTGPVHPGHQPTARRPKRFGWLAICLVGVVGLVLGSAIGSAGDPAAGAISAAPGATVTATATITAGGTEQAEARQPAPTATVTVTAKAKPVPEPAAPAEITDGSYLVGEEIATGTWKSGKSDGLCYADTKNSKGDILEQELASEGATTIILIKKNAYIFTSSGCGSWRKVG